MLGYLREYKLGHLWVTGSSLILHNQPSWLRSLKNKVVIVATPACLAKTARVLTRFFYFLN